MRPAEDEETEAQTGGLSPRSPGWSRDGGQKVQSPGAQRRWILKTCTPVPPLCSDRAPRGSPLPSRAGRVLGVLCLTLPVAMDAGHTRT